RAAADHYAVDCAATRPASKYFPAVEFWRLVANGNGRRARHLLFELDRSDDETGLTQRCDSRLWRVRVGFAAARLSAQLSSWRWFSLVSSRDRTVLDLSTRRRHRQLPRHYSVLLHRCNHRHERSRIRHREPVLRQAFDRKPREESRPTSARKKIARNSAVRSAEHHHSRQVLL